MNIETLELCLNGSNHELQYQSYAPQEMSADPDIRNDPTEEFWNRYNQEENEYLRAIRTLRSELAGTFTDGCVFLYGSASRLEFIPGRSDLDFVPIASKCRKISDRATAEIVKKAAQEAMRVEAQSSKSREGNILGCTVDVAMKGDVFFSTVDLFEEVGKAEEMAWSRSLRCFLFFESAHVIGDARIADLHCARAEEMCGLQKDIEKRAFPKLTLTFLREFKESVTIGPLLNEGMTTKNKNEEEENDEVRAKAIVRKWGILTNELILHLLFWRSRHHLPTTELPPDRNDIGDVFRGGTHYKLLKVIPDLYRNCLTATLEVWADKHLKDDEERDEMIKQVSGLKERFRTGQKRRGNERLSLPRMWQRVWSWCHDVRVQGCEFSDSRREEIGFFEEEMKAVLNTVRGITLMFVSRDKGTAAAGELRALLE